MKQAIPPIDPNQLPPKGDDYLFINATPEPVGPVTFLIDGGAQTITIPLVPPATTAVARAPAPLQPQQVECHVDVGAPPMAYDFAFGPPDVPGGFFVASLHCGLRAGSNGGYVPFAVAIVSDGVGAVEVIALDQ